MSSQSGLGLLAAAGEHSGQGGFQPPDTSLFHWEPLFSIGWFDFTKPMLLALVAAAALLALAAAAFARPSLVPRGVQNVGEMGYLFVRDQIARQVIGHDADTFVPFLVSLFFFVWFANILAVVPVAQFPVPSRIAFPAALAAMVWLTYMFLGLKHQGGLGYFRNMMFPPGLPAPIYILLAPIELVSNVFVRPFTLAVRLFANMFAGHLLLAISSIAAWYFIVESPGVLSLVGGVGFVAAVVLTAFELLIQALQAFIFTLLTAVYIGSALTAEH